MLFVTISVYDYAKKESAEMVSNMFNQKYLRCLEVCILGLIVINSSTVYARSVFVNGELLKQYQLTQLDQAHCMTIPDGRYWLRQQGNTGVWVWGYEATPWLSAGVIGEECEGYTTHNAVGNRRDPETGLWRGTGGDSNCIYTDDGASTCF